MVEYLHHMQYLADSLGAVGQLIPDDDLVLHTLDGLSDYGSFYHHRLFLSSPSLFLLLLLLSCEVVSVAATLILVFFLHFRNP